MLADVKVVSDSPLPRHVRGTIARTDQPARPCRFPKYRRIRKRSGFNRLRQVGRKLYSKHLLLIVNPNSGFESRLGITVTRRVDKRAVQRNRFKRVIREIFRQHNQHFREPIDLVVIARQEACQCRYADLARELLGRLRAQGYLKP